MHRFYFWFIHMLQWKETKGKEGFRSMNILFVGDVVGSPGRDMVKEYVPRLKEKYRPHITIINGENAAGGKGITEKIYRSFLEVGAQAVTLGNHTWDNRDIFEFIDDAKYMVRPANFPEDNPGKGIVYLKMNQDEIAIISLQGRTFMQPIDDPFRKADELIEEASKRTPIIFVDFHAEATSEKLAMGWYLDGRVSAVVGTHTHVQTADNRVLPGGTAYISDVGMTGPYDGILGVDREVVIRRFLTNLPGRFEVPDTDKTQLSAVHIELDKKTGKAKKIERILINEDHPFFS
jgi:2',3'-cyclic-nucleotide 2'-phosphodiesterase